MTGVFAVGDVRSDKRVGTAIGEAATVAQQLRAFLEMVRTNRSDQPVQTAAAVRSEIIMRVQHTQDYSVPPPGTTEALQLGCICHVIYHETKAEELEPAGMLAAPDANCPVHGSSAQLEEHN